jgi:hypothetical protein
MLMLKCCKYSEIKYLKLTNFVGRSSRTGATRQIRGMRSPTASSASRNFWDILAQHMEEIKTNKISQQRKPQYCLQYHSRRLTTKKHSRYLCVLIVFLWHSTT